MKRIRLLASVLVFAAMAAAQGPPPGGPGGRGMRHGPPPEPGPNSEKWWADPMIIRRLNLSDEQQHRIDDVFQKNRLRLIDLKAALEKEEVLLEPLLDADRPDESQVLAQIDRVANARSELEKANARMLLGFRLVLTSEQWKRLQPRNEIRGPDREPRH